MILYFDKYGTLIERDNEGESWVQGDDNSYSLKVKFYDEIQANINENTPFIDLSNYVVNCVVEREDGSITPTLSMNRFDENTGAKVLVDNWWTEINGNINITIRLVDVLDNSVKATGLATITINKGNIPADTLITNSEKSALEEAIALKEDSENKTTNVRTEEQASDVLYPSEKAVAKIKSALLTIINNLNETLESVSTQTTTNKTNIQTNLLKIESLGRDINNLTLKDNDLQLQINNIIQQITQIAIGADFVPKTRTIAEISLENNITSNQLYDALINLFGTSAKVNTGTGVGQVPTIQNDGKLPKSIIPISDALMRGGYITRVNDTGALITPSEKFREKYPEVGDEEVYVSTETTAYKDVYFVVRNATDETILGIPKCNSKDWIVADGVLGFSKIDNNENVESVNGKTGEVIINAKDTILENYATSELDDNNIYPTDSAQTGISKLDKRTKELESKITTSLPNVIFEIKDLNNPTVSEKAVIISKVKELTNDFTTDLDKTKFNEIVLKNDIGTTEAPDLRQYSLVNYEYKEDQPLYFKFTFNLDNNTEYEVKVWEDDVVDVTKTEFATKAYLDEKIGDINTILATLVEVE